MSGLRLPSLFLAVALMSAPVAAAPAVQRAEVAQGLYEIVYSPRLDAVFVASSGGRGDAAEPSRILRLNPATLAVEGEIALSGTGFGLALDDAAGRLYVGDTVDASIMVVDLAAGRVTDTIRLAVKVTGDDGKAEYPHHFRQLVLDPAHHRLYAPGLSFTGSALYVVDTDALAVETVVPGFGFVASGAALDAAQGRLFVSNMEGELIAYDTAAGQIVDRDRTGGDQLLNLALDPKGGRIFATDQGHEFFRTLWDQWLPDYEPRGDGNQILTLDVGSGTQTGAFPTGTGPIAVLFDDARDRLFVTNRGDGSITVFDAGDLALIDTIPVPAHPNSLALDAEHNVLFATVKNGDGAAEGSKESVVRIGF